MQDKQEYIKSPFKTLFQNLIGGNKKIIKKMPSDKWLGLKLGNIQTSTTDDMH